ncbi:protein HID1 [Tribolium castaneum]|uniref:Protein HID1-like Protein n=1 Tax=Tribolium castaneum TaxID=7070 RepID=D6WWB7_TRICA|nr:PREDICTED: protein HID1 [Tribolium castaneum]EFA08688.1 Protein HID1-like Protein [Tribolium castaneum]|eukprot:XP_008196769.1 PREDICTED: protein HID1 [Tribolium castaneum]
MGNVDTKLNFRKAVVQLTSKSEPIDANDDSFWEQFWSENVTNVQDIFTLVPAAEIRALREDAPSNLATLCYKAVEKLVKAVDSSCRTQHEQQTVLNCARLLTRILPYIFEDPEWRGFFWSSLPSQGEDEDESVPLAQSLLNAVCDLLFCPDFTVVASRKSGPDKAEELSAIDSCEYIWEAGVGFAHSPPRSPVLDSNRTELLKLLLTCFSETMYQPPTDISQNPNKWIAHLTSSENRHALPMFTSLLNTVCAYDPVGLGVPYNHLLFNDSLEPLVEAALQILIVTLDHDTSSSSPAEGEDSTVPDNLFINYLSRIHRDEDFEFILTGVTRLLNNPLVQTYLPNSTKKVHFHQELLVFFWKMCDYNKKFLYFVLKSSDVLEVLVPILYHLNDSRADQSRVGLMHIGVFILLLLSGERNFGVRLNKPYTATIPMDIPVFTGTHADLLIIVFHKIITTGHQRLQPLFDCLLTILVNVSPYLKTLSMVASTKLLHLLEAFSTPWFLFSSSTNHHLVFFLLEIFNNIIQYQFDGNSNLVYTIIRKRQVFHNLANLPSDYGTIAKSLNKRTRSRMSSTTSHENVAELAMEGSHPALPAEPGTLKATLPDTPGIGQMTEKEPAHPSYQNEQLLTNGMASITMNTPTASTPEEPTNDNSEQKLSRSPSRQSVATRNSLRVSASGDKNPAHWTPTGEWVHSWKSKLPLQTIMRLLQVLVPQVEKICIDKGLTDESEILKFLQHGTLVGLLPVPHPILIRKYQANSGTTTWFRTYMWGVIYLRNVDPPVWYDTDVKLFEIQRI